MAIENIRKFPEEEGAETLPQKPNKVRRKREASDFFSTWLERGSKDIYRNNHESDDDKSNDKLKKPKGFYKRFLKPWHGFFAQLSEAEPLKLNGDHNQPSLLQSKPENQPTNQEHDGQARVNEASRQTLNDGGWREDQPILPNASQSHEQSSESAQSDKAELPNITKNSDPLPANLGGGGDVPPPQSPESSLNPQPEPNNYESNARGQNINVQTTTAEHRHRPDWGPALVVGMYEGHLSRKRDRKINRDINKINNKIDESLVQPNPNLSSQSQRAEAFNAITPNKAPEAAPLTNLKYNTQQPTIGYEAKSKNTQFKELVTQNESLTSEDNSSPEVILKEVAKAAEKNVPIEAIFERRHEVKDQPKDDYAMSPDEFFGSNHLSSNIAPNQSDSQTTRALNKASNSVQIDDTALQSSLAKGGVIGLILLVVVVIALLIF